MNIAKMLFPLLTLPYLTRVLSTDCYGSVVYVKSVTTYLQLLVDFGFVLSATKSIVQAREDRARQERIMGDVLLVIFLMDDRIKTDEVSSRCWASAFWPASPVPDGKKDRGNTAAAGPMAPRSAGPIKRRSGGQRRSEQDCFNAAGHGPGIV